MQKRSAVTLPMLVTVLASLLVVSTAVPSKATSLDTVLSPKIN
ncbi:MAG: hypothetical protein ACRD5H_09780 [Nitrososphaerales archaeon]